MSRYRDQPGGFSASASGPSEKHLTRSMDESERLHQCCEEGRIGREFQSGQRVRAPRAVPPRRAGFPVAALLWRASGAQETHSPPEF